MAQLDRPSISDDVLFETLLKQGCSAEKAARIAHKRDPLLDWENGEGQPIVGRAAPSKEELVESLRRG